MSSACSIILDILQASFCFLLAFLEILSVIVTFERSNPTNNKTEWNLNMLLLKALGTYTPILPCFRDGGDICRGMEGFVYTQRQLKIY